MEIPLYESSYVGEPFGTVGQSFIQTIPDKLTIDEGTAAQNTFDETITTYIVAVPDDLTASVNKTLDVLEWGPELSRKRSTPSEVLRFAEDGTHGFRLVPQEDEPVGSE